MSPRFGPIGLAIVPAALAAPGTDLQAVTADGAIPGTVDVLSIYDPKKSVRAADRAAGRSHRMTEDVRSPLHDWHMSRGAEVIWEDGFPWAMDEGTPVNEEYEAIRTGTGIWDLFSTCKYEVTGPDATRLIQRRFTNSLAGMADGAVRYGAFVNADGNMVDDGNVYKFSDDRYWVLINSAGFEDWFTRDGERSRRDDRAQDARPRDDRGAGPDVAGDAAAAHRARPRRARLLPVLADDDHGRGRARVCAPHRLQRRAWYEIVMDPSNARVVWDALLAAGATAFGLNAIDLARTEVGLIIIAVDYQPGETSPWDVSMDRFIKTDTENVGRRRR